MDDCTAWLMAFTLPSFLWVVLRFSAIFYERWSAILYHIKHDGRIACAHIVGSMCLVPIFPYMIWLNIVPPDDTETVPEPHRACVRTLIILALLSNVSAMYMLPAPFRFKEYGMTKRAFMRTLAFHYVSCLQFTAMPLQSLIMLDRSKLNVAIVLGTGYLIELLYTLSCIISAFEIWSHEGLAWEAYLLPSALLAPRAKAAAKSRLMIVSRELLDSPGGLNNVFLVLGIVGVLSCIQTAFQLQCVALGLPAFSRMDDFYAVSVLYMTVMMMAGYFLTFQTQTSPNNPFTGWMGMTDLKTRQVVDTFMTQILPVFPQAIGAWWCRMEARTFVYCYATWCVKPSP